MTSAVCILAAPDIEAEPAIVQLAAGLSLRILRRSLDAADLLAVSFIEPQTAVVLSAGLPRLTAEVVATLQRGDRRVLGLAQTSADEDRLRALGVLLVVMVRTPELTLTQILQSLTGNIGPLRGHWETGAWNAPSLTSVASEPADILLEFKHEGLGSKHEGQVLAIWGPYGAPGRTTATLAVAKLMAATGKSVCVIDADTSGPSMTLLFSVIEDASGIVVACRYAQRGSLRKESLLTVVRNVAAGIGVIGGVSHPDRWEELHPHSFREVLNLCRSTFDYTCVDLGAGLDPIGSDPESFELQRFSAASTALREADAVLAVGLATPLGLSRLLTSLGLVMSLARQEVAIAIRKHDDVDAQQAIATLRAYGCQQEIFEMPKISTHDVVHPSGFKRNRRVLRKQHDQWTALESWAMRSRQGEGSTTMSVPTRANL